MKTRWISLIILLTLILTGCGQGRDLSPMEPKLPPSLEEPAAPPDNSSPNPTKPVEVSPLSTPQPDSPPRETPHPCLTPPTPPFKS